MMEHSRFVGPLCVSGLTVFILAHVILGSRTFETVMTDGAPPALPRLSIPQLSPDGFVQFTVPDERGPTHVLEASTGLVHWTSICTNVFPATACLDCPVIDFEDPHTYSPAAFGGGGTNGAPITWLGFAALSGPAASPGDVPLYKSGEPIGGVGAAVTGKPPIPELYDIQTEATQRPDVDENVALAGQIGFGPPNTIIGSDVRIDGIRLPYVNSNSSTNRGS